jgi:hypothetical protein
MFSKVRSIFASRAAYWLRHLATRVTAISHAKPTVEHATIARYAGWCWSDATERTLNDDLTGKRNQSFPP